MISRLSMRILAPLFAWVLTLFPAADTAADPGSDLKIGVIASLTGKGAARGESARKGLDFASQSLRERYPRIMERVRLIVEDVPLDTASRGPTAFSRLADVEKVCAVIGPMGSPVAAAVAPLAENRGVPTVIHTASLTSLTEGRPHVFRIWPLATQYAQMIAARIRSLGWRSLLMLTADAENTADLSAALRAVAGSEVKIFEERVSPKETDLRTVLLRLTAREGDALFLNLFEGQIAPAASQSSALGIRLPLITNPMMSGVELSLDPHALEGIWFPDSSLLSAPIREKMKASLTVPPADVDCFAAAHDALVSIVAALSEVGCDRERLAVAIRTRPVEGIMGTHRFTSGNFPVPLGLFTVRNGVITALAPEPQ